VRVDFVLRVRDDDFFVDDVDIGGMIEALGTQFDLLAGRCGDWGGLNDRTYFLRRASAAFDAVSVGQLAAAYMHVAPDPNKAFFVHNPEWLLLHAVTALHGSVRVALAPPCQFNSLTLRNLTSSRCFDRAVVSSSVDWTDEHSRFRCNLMEPDERFTRTDLAACSRQRDGAIASDLLQGTGALVCPWLSN
jgi:hypothetical protein